MNIITARFNVPALAGPLSIPASFTMPVTGKLLINLAVARSEAAGCDLIHSGYRVLDGRGTQIFPAVGYADNTAVHDGRGLFAPLSIFQGPLMVEGINQELSGPPYALKIEVYNEDAAAFIVFVHAAIGEDLKPLAVSVFNFRELIDPIGGVIQNLIDRVFPPKG